MPMAQGHGTLGRHERPFVRPPLLTLSCRQLTRVEVAQALSAHESQSDSDQLDPKASLEQIRKKSSRVCIDAHLLKQRPNLLVSHLHRVAQAGKVVKPGWV